MKKLARIFVCLALIVGLAYTPVVVPQLTDTQIVAEADAATIKINKKKVTVRKGATAKLKITGTKKKVTWSSANKSIATVSKYGVVKGKKAGKVKITAKVGKKKYVCTVTVKNRMTVGLKNVKFDGLNKTKTVKVTFVGDGTISWDCDNTDVVQPKWGKGWNGNTTTLKLTSKGAGTATVKLTNDMNNEVYKIKVTVTNKKWSGEEVVEVLEDAMDAFDWAQFAVGDASNAYTNQIMGDEYLPDLWDSADCMIDSIEYLAECRDLLAKKNPVYLSDGRTAYNAIKTTINNAPMYGDYGDDLEAYFNATIAYTNEIAVILEGLSEFAQDWTAKQ